MSRPTLEDEFDPETIDDLQSILSNGYTRGVIDYFHRCTDDVASLDELANYVVDAQFDCAAESPRDAAIYLHHAGLPKLADVGLLEYDERSNHVRRRDHPVLEASRAFREYAEFDDNAGVA
ncbi:DUF7344 domain-containing protein [Natronosalvus caseinilyticus]|uniref:DUF7344 domain-containing protein n=1 Tax=Natronosalvus caseinilyticus TaxID=2953747 RepID=UPI0028A72B35|nr:hypothetical protein [Natronosalvus caseinilyticus]